ncbi:MAG: Proline dehydrogenase [uncultured Thermomicrobiales bacterium]|uniref:proline dehydrogenase n=1 Tax=uncultured Thermomicrobiales bacterium TaxID=1645740 RepID=A0A6J4VEN3_9BACT|nr:MAG: Proline dehydrogenase [uncultured Thermomicrobiales bacterium]
MATSNASPAAPATVETTSPSAPSVGGPGDRLARRLNPVLRKGILLATHNRPIAALVRRHGMRLGAANFVAGTTLDEAVVNLRRLNGLGMRTNTTILGEAIRDEGAVARVVESYVGVLDRIAAERLTTNLAVKLTQLGLDLDEEVAYRNVERLVRHAATHGNFVRIDMEEFGRVDATLRIYERLRAAGHDNVGTVLQSYLYRTEADLERLAPLRPNLRLVKGAYLESPEVSYPRKTEIDAAYLRLAERMLVTNSFTAIATHDDRLIEHVIRHAETHGIPKDRFEFQMLYGIRPALQQGLVARGYGVLVATPFGPDWYFFYMRRLAERPANVLNFARSLFRPS